MHSKFTGQTMIFSKELNERTIYNAGISMKNAEGEYVNSTILINFTDKPTIPNKSMVELKNGWLSFYFKKDTKIPVFYIVCNEYEVIDKPDDPQEGFAQLPEDIPF